MIQHVGPVRDMPAEKVVEAAGMVKEGRSYSLSVPRFPGMPLFPGHPPFQVVNYRTPPGIRAGGLQPWGPPNEVGLGYMAEYLMACSHSGAHIDALGHMTIGDDNHWYGGGNTAEHLTDHGPTVGDASHLPPFFTRGVLLDPPTYRGVDALPRSEPVTADELQAVAEAQGVEVRPWDVVLIRTGYLKYWPDAEAMNEHLTAGPDLSAAEWLLERGVVATGTDTSFTAGLTTVEVQPGDQGLSMEILEVTGPETLSLRAATAPTAAIRTGSTGSSSAVRSMPSACGSSSLPNRRTAASRRW